MRIFEHLSILAVAAFAFGAVGVANASAESLFTASETGEFTGHALETQVFRTAAGKLECPAEDMKISGPITEKASLSLHPTIRFGTRCKFAGFTVNITVSLTWTLRPFRRIQFKGTFTVTVTAGIFGECTLTFPEGQELGTVTYTNNGGKIKVTPEVTGIHYTSSGGLCGSAGEHTDGIYTGAFEVERVGGGSISWDE